MVQNNHIKNCDTTIQNIDVAQEIWIKDIDALKGKTTCNNTNVVAEGRIKIPRELQKLKKTVFLTAELFFVNGITFFISISRNIKFTEISHLSGRESTEIFKAFKIIFRFYLQSGFRITTVHADGEFAAIHQFIQGIPGGPRLNRTRSNEHVPEIERIIQVVKERSRAMIHSLPFNRIPKLMIIHAILNISKMLNYFLTKGVIAKEMSPR